MAAPAACGCAPCCEPTPNPAVEFVAAVVNDNGANVALSAQVINMLPSMRVQVGFVWSTVLEEPTLAARTGTSPPLVMRGRAGTTTVLFHGVTNELEPATYYVRAYMVLPRGVLLYSSGVSSFTVPEPRTGVTVR